MLPIIQIVAAVLGVLLDQWFKQWTVLHISAGENVKCIPGLIHLTYVENDGAALSMFSGMRWILFALSVVFVIGGIWILVAKKIEHPLGSWALAAVISGAAGNAVDRLLNGYVVDMLEFEIVLDFFVFNIADVFITLGGLAFCVYLLMYELKQSKQNSISLSGEKYGEEDNDKL